MSSVALPLCAPKGRGGAAHTQRGYGGGVRQGLAAMLHASSVAHPGCGRLFPGRAGRHAVVVTLPGRTHPNTCSLRGSYTGPPWYMHRCRPSWRHPPLLPPCSPGAVSRPGDQLKLTLFEVARFGVPCYKASPCWCLSVAYAPRGDGRPLHCLEQLLSAQSQSIRTVTEVEALELRRRRLSAALPPSSHVSTPVGCWA